MNLSIKALFIALCLEGVIAFDGLQGSIEEVECVDLAPEGTLQCQDWASNGECDKNPEFMHQQCRASCGICSTAVGFPEPCEDIAVEGVRQCREWAWHGECEKNPEFMHNNCRRSCDRCPPGSIEPMLFCEDAFGPECQKWKEDGLCGGNWKAKKGKETINSAFVVEFCPRSCDVCDVHLDDRDFSLNLGIPQSAPEIEDKEVRNRVKYQVNLIREYVSTLEPELQEVCKLAHPFCARFALSMDCEENEDDDIMKYMCAASCQTCELLRNDREGIAKAKMYYAKALHDHHYKESSTN